MYGSKEIIKDFEILSEGLVFHGLSDDTAMKFTGGKQVMQTQKNKDIWRFFFFIPVKDNWSFCGLLS